MLHFVLLTITSYDMSQTLNFLHLHSFFRKDFGLLKALSVLAGKEEDDDAVEESTTEIIFSALLRNILWCKSLYNASGRAEVSLYF